MIKTKLIILVAALLLGTAGVAYAATGGELTGALGSGLAALTGSSDSDGSDTDGDNDDGSTDDQDESHGDDVSTVARDPEATGTKTLPNGNEIENHGLAVSEQARLHDDDPDGDDPDDDDNYDDDDNDDDDNHAPPTTPPPAPDDNDDDSHSSPSGGSSHDNDNDGTHSGTTGRSR